MKKNCALLKTIGLAMALLLLSSAFGHIVIGEEKLDNSSIGNLGTLAYYPESYHFGNKLEDEADSTTFEIWRAGGCCALEYTLSWDCSWVDVFPTSGTSHGEHDTITVDIHTTGLELGFHTCKILIWSNGGNGEFTVVVNIVQDTEPTLVYYPKLYDFRNKLEGETDSTTFEIWNSGYGTLSYTLSWDCSWVDVFPTSGTSYGEHDTITVDIHTTGLELGFHTCKILIWSNGGNEVFAVKVNIIDLNPILSYNPQSHDFGNKFEGETDSTTFEIWNSGFGTLSYSLIWDCNWVNISPPTGSSDGEHDTITAFINTTGLSIGCNSCNISISSNGGNGIFTVTTNITEQPNNPPTPPSINGPKSGNIGTPYTYNFVSIDPDEDDVSYYIEWGDGSTTTWTTFQSSGSLGYSESHTWNTRGIYTIKAKAKDKFGVESDWATLEVSMPKNKPSTNPLFLQTLEQLIQRFPLLARLLQLPVFEKLLNLR